MGGLDGGILGRITDEVEHEIKDALKDAEKLVDKLPQDVQDAIHDAERKVKGMRETIYPAAAEWLAEQITPKGMNEFVRALVMGAIKSLAVKRFKEDDAASEAAAGGTK